jgi:uncharacterized membrane protein
MKTRLVNLWYRMSSSYWFLPAVMVAGIAGLAYAAYLLDQILKKESIGLTAWIFSGDIDGARSVLETIASSMITVASVVFSITIVVLSLTISQYGPLLIRNFMHDKVNQVVLGTFVATFTYCLLLLRTLRNEDQSLPNLSITIGVVLGFASIGVLIYFIHHMAASIQSNNVIASVGRDLKTSVCRLFPEQAKGERDDGLRNGQDIPADFAQGRTPVLAEKCGYIQAMDTDGLLKTASRENLLIQLLVRPGHFVIEGHPLARAWPADRAGDEIAREVCKAILVGTERTLEQDVEFAVNQIVEIALRALSPALNDPLMAATCIDWLGAGLSEMTRRQTPPKYLYDQSNKLRLIISPLDFVELVDNVFAKMRQSVCSNLPVTIRTLETIRKIAETLGKDEDRMALRRHSFMIVRGSYAMDMEEWERKTVEGAYRAATRALQKPTGSSART